jgi:hypothetical protein
MPPNSTVAESGEKALQRASNAEEFKVQGSRFDRAPSVIEL